MERQDSAPAWYGEAALAAQSPSTMFQNATRFGVERSQFMNIQGNMNIHPPATTPRDQELHSTGIIGAMATGTGNIPPPSQDTAGGVYTESGTYCSQLLRQGRGFPLYVPGPQINLPAEYRRRGVSIGDVGRVTPDGVFDFFFNIYCPPDHPINANTPEDFVPLAPYDTIDVLDLKFDAGNYVSTPSVQDRGISEPFPGGEFIFNCVGPNGAALALPHGSCLKKLENLESMRRYAAKHAESWYNYVNGTRGRGLANGSLYLVTGCEKTKSWGMASFRDVTAPNEFQLSFKPSVDANAGYKYRWRRGTPARQKHADPPAAAGAPLNQTTFIHAFTISLCEGIWGKLFGDVEICQLVDSQLGRSGFGFVPHGSQRSPFSWSFGLFGGGTAAGGKQYTGQSTAHGNVVVSDAVHIPQIVHPSRIINQHILQQFPEATVAITHDDDWAGTLHELKDGTGSVKDEQEFLDRVFQDFRTVEENGTVFLLSKSTAPSKDVVFDIAINTVDTGLLNLESAMSRRRAKRAREEESTPPSEPSDSNVTDRPAPPKRQKIEDESEHTSNNEPRFLEAQSPLDSSEPEEEFYIAEYDECSVLDDSRTLDSTPSLTLSSLMTSPESITSSVLPSPLMVTNVLHDPPSFYDEKPSSELFPAVPPGWTFPYSDSLHASAERIGRTRTTSSTPEIQRRKSTGAESGSPAINPVDTSAKSATRSRSSAPNLPHTPSNLRREWAE